MKSRDLVIGAVLGLGLVWFLGRKKNGNVAVETIEEGEEESLGGGGGGGGFGGGGGSTTADIVETTAVVPTTAVVYPTTKPYYPPKDPIKEAIASGELVLSPAPTSTTTTSPTPSSPPPPTARPVATETMKKFNFLGEYPRNTNLDLDIEID